MKEKIKLYDFKKIFYISILIFIFIFFNLLNINIKAQSKDDYKLHKMKINYSQYIENNIFTINDLYNKDFSQPLIHPENSKITRYNKQKIILTKKTNYSIGYIKEKESKYIINSDTLKLIKNNLNKINPRKNNYKIDFYSISQSLEGISFNKKITHKNNFSLSLINKMLFGKKLIKRNYEGKAYKENDELIIEAFNHGINSNLNNIDENHNYSSYGYSLGIDTNYNFHKNLSINFYAKNLWSKIYWQKIFTNVSEINTDNIIINEEGYKEYISSVTGNSYFDEYKTRLTPEYNFNANNKSYNIGIFYRNKLYPYFNCKVNSNPEIRVGFWSEYLTLKIKNNIFNLEIRTNNFLPSKITSIYLKLGINYSF